MCDSIRLPASPCRSNPKPPPPPPSPSPPPPPPSLHSFPRYSSSSSSSNQRFRNPHSSFSAKLHVRALTASTSNGPSLDPDSSSSSLVSVDLSPICTESHFDQVVSDGPVIIMWTASWCRKCIYLKPKMEKLAAEYLPRMQFYCVDVNKFPHKLVAHAAVTKMPTVQLWRDGKKQDEVIGGDKAHLIVNDVREMIDNDSEI